MGWGGSPCPWGRGSGARREPQDPSGPRVLSEAGVTEVRARLPRSWEACMAQASTCHGGC